jgi:hypothetical protein
MSIVIKGVARRCTSSMMYGELRSVGIHCVTANVNDGGCRHRTENEDSEYPLYCFVKFENEQEAMEALPKIRGLFDVLVRDAPHRCFSFLTVAWIREKKKPHMYPLTYTLMLSDVESDELVDSMKDKHGPLQVSTTKASTGTGSVTYLNFKNFAGFLDAYHEINGMNHARARPRQYATFVLKLLDRFRERFELDGCVEMTMEEVQRVAIDNTHGLPLLKWMQCVADNCEYFSIDFGRKVVIACPSDLPCPIKKKKMHQLPSDLSDTVSLSSESLANTTTEPEPQTTLLVRDVAVTRLRKKKQAIDQKVTCWISSFSDPHESCVTESDSESAISAATTSGVSAGVTGSMFSETSTLSPVNDAFGNRVFAIPCDPCPFDPAIKRFETWSSKEVAAFFQECGFDHQVITNNAVDGRTLLYMINDKEGHGHELATRSVEEGGLGLNELRMQRVLATARFTETEDNTAMCKLVNDIVN